MSNHNKILKISIIVIVLTAIISIISISKLRIDNQVFLKNYYEIAVNEYEGTYSLEEGSLILQYISNVDEIKYEKGQTIKENSIVTITSKYNGSDEILKNYTLYNISPNIHFINEYNDEYTYRYNNMESFNVRNYDSFYNSYGIYKYLKARGEL